MTHVSGRWKQSEYYYYYWAGVFMTIGWLGARGLTVPRRTMKTQDVMTIMTTWNVAWWRELWWQLFDDSFPASASSSAASLSPSLCIDIATAAAAFTHQMAALHVTAKAVCVCWMNTFPNYNRMRRHKGYKRPSGYPFIVLLWDAISFMSSPLYKTRCPSLDVRTTIIAALLLPRVNCSALTRRGDGQIDKQLHELLLQDLLVNSTLCTQWGVR